MHITQLKLNVGPSYNQALHVMLTEHLDVNYGAYKIKDRRRQFCKENKINYQCLNQLMSGTNRFGCPLAVSKGTSDRITAEKIAKAVGEEYQAEMFLFYPEVTPNTTMEERQDEP